MDIFAVFVVAPVGNGIAATTRAADRGEAGRIGLPGGKVDAGESLRSAALRESAEEGWAIAGLANQPFHTAIVEGKLVAWFRATSATALRFYKEQSRIKAITASTEAVAQSGYGNCAAMAAWEGCCEHPEERHYRRSLRARTRAQAAVAASRAATAKALAQAELCQFSSTGGGKAARYCR